MISEIRDWEGHTFLTVIRPICIDGGKVCFTEACHQRDFPEDCLDPKSLGGYLYVAICTIYRNEFNVNLFGFEAIAFEIVEILRGKVGACFREPDAFIGCKFYLAEFYREMNG